MSKKFLQRWQGHSGSLLRTPKSLKPQIGYAINLVELQIRKLNNYINQYTEHDKELFKKIIQAYERHDNSRATILANELAEIQRQRYLLVNAKLVLEDVVLRLQTVLEFGNFVSETSPVVGNLQNIQIRVSEILPEFGRELGQVRMNLNNLKIKTGQSAGTTFDFGVGGEDAQKIIEEAAIVVENRTKMKFPDIPNNESGQGGT